MADNYLNDTNPEILRAMPRPGGRAKLLQEGPSKAEGLSSSSKVSTLDATTSRRPSASRKGKKSVTISSAKASAASLTAMHKGFGKLFESAVRMSQVTIEKEDPKMADMTKEYRIYSAMSATPWMQEIDEILEEELREEMPNPLQDSVDLLSITISTVMLLAIGYGSIPREHLSWSMNFLKLIKNDVDECPPNIQGIINHIKKAHASISSLTELDGPGFNSTTNEEAAAEAPPPAAEEAPADEEAE